MQRPGIEVESPKRVGIVRWPDLKRKARPAGGRKRTLTDEVFSPESILLVRLKPSQTKTVEGDQMETETQLGYMRLPEILSLFPVGKSTWWEGVRIQKYPRPVKLGARITAWRKSDILKLLENPEKSYFPD